LLLESGCLRQRADVRFSVLTPLHRRRTVRVLRIYSRSTKGIFMTKTPSHSPTQRAKLLARTLAGVAVTLCVAQAAHAQMMSDTMMSPGTSYIGLTGGPSDFSRTKGGNGLFPNDDRSTAYSLSVGNYFINPNLGAELVFAPQWSAVLQYDEHFMKFAGSSSERISTTMIGARIRF
jgi:hypothetical protein